MMQADINQVCEVLKSLKVPEHDLEMAGRLFDRDCVELVTALDESLKEETLLIYHLNLDRIGEVYGSRLLAANCDIAHERMKCRNGVVLKEGHDGLVCSRRSCGCEVCPLALAACFRACVEGGMRKDETPLLSAYLELRQKISQGDAFLEKWSERLVDSQVAINLLVSNRENDFAGSVVLRDQSNLWDFIKDVYELMCSMGETEDLIDSDGTRRHRVVPISLLRLFNSVTDDEEGAIHFIQGGELLPNYLFVLTGLGEFNELAKSANSNFGLKLQLNVLFDCLGSITDDRFVLIVGSEGEVSDFCSLDKRFEATFGQHRLRLPSMSTDEIYDQYFSFLDTAVRDRIEDQQAFRDDFKRFVSFNRDSIPYTGRELADYLAKHANALRRPEFPSSTYRASSMSEMLDSVIGLQQVKDTIRNLESYVTLRKLCEAEGMQLEDMSLHMLFSGNPGTGKTMMAKMIATMLYKIGIIKQNKIVEVTAKDLVAEHVGGTSIKTSEKINDALGGILFVDEAYALAGGERESLFGTQAVDELVKAMDQYKDKLIVILAGYDREMSEFMDTNPGLASRIGYKFRFEDYTTEELVQIFKGTMESQGFKCDEDVLTSSLPDLFGYYRNFQSFGNGRFVRQVLSRMVVKHAKALEDGKVDSDHTFVFSAADVPTRQELNDITDWTQRPAKDLLEPLVGIKDVKEKVGALESVVTFQETARKRGLKIPDSNLHMLFTGNPGTGKTTVARIIGKVLYNVGALPTDKFHEIEARDLARRNSRNGQNDTAKLIQNAMGGVLFVDEAYAILRQADADDIIATLVKAMEDHKGEFAVIFAGYDNEMQEFVDRNPGLASRIGYKFHFEDYTTEELQEIFEGKVSRIGFTLTDEAKSASLAVFKYFHNVEDFGNGRFVDKLIQEIIAKHATNVSDDTVEIIDVPDIPTVEEMCKSVAMSVYAPSTSDDDEDAIRKVAIHEIGHATCLFALEGKTNILLITIEEEGNGALGYVQHKSNVPIRTAQDIRNRIAVNLGGLAAEELMLGCYGVGGGSDLEQATSLARTYVGTLGLSRAGLLQYVGKLGLHRGEGIHNLPEEVREAMRDLLDEEFARAKEVIAEHQEAYDAMVEELCNKGTITGEEMSKIWKRIEGDNYDE